MNRVKTLFVLFQLLCISSISQAQDTINTQKVKKNTIYLQVGNNQLFYFYHQITHVLFDLHYTRNFSNLFKGNIGFKSNNYIVDNITDYSFTNEKNLFYVGGGLDIKLCKGLYLIPNVNIGISQLPFDKFCNEYSCRNDCESGVIYKWIPIINGDLLIEYRLDSWRFHVGMDYIHVLLNKEDKGFTRFEKGKNFAAKLGVGFSF